jgi:hypothetical protein
VVHIRPLARTEDVVTEDVADEMIVYDERIDVACRLNRSAALVWRSSDGKRTLADLVRVLEADLGDVADEDMVLLALDSLADHGLIESGYESRDATASRLSRRRFFGRVGRVGVATVAIPVVASMAVPVAAAAGSGGGYAPYYNVSDRRLKRNIRTLVGRP